MELANIIMTAIQTADEQSGMDAMVAPDDYGTVQSACSHFRSAITNELLSRETIK